MTRDEAVAWATGSAYIAPVFHATSRDAAATIRQDGFDLSLKRFGRVWGNGVYATPDPISASIYADLYGDEGIVLELRARVSRILSVRLASRGGSDAFLQVLTSFPDGYMRFVELTIELRRFRPTEYVRPDAFTRTIVEAGYDALDITEVRFTPAVGGSQLVVYDPRKVVVVEG